MKTILLTGCALGLLLNAQAHATEAPLEGTLSKIASAKSITLGYRDASVPFSYVLCQVGCEIPGLNLGTASDTGKLESRRGGKALRLRKISVNFLRVVMGAQACTLVNRGGASRSDAKAHHIFQ